DCDGGWFHRTAGDRARLAAGCARHRVPATGLAGVARHSGGFDRYLHRDCDADRRADCGACGGPGLQRERPRGGDSLPPRREDGRIAVGLSLGCRAEAEAAREGRRGMITASHAESISADNIETRVEQYDWTAVQQHLDAHGWATFPGLLTAPETSALAD